MISKIIKKLLYSYRYSSESFISYMRNKGVQIGSDCYIYSPQTVAIDLARPYLLDIGDNVVITRNTTIMLHDYSHTVIRKKYGRNIGDAKPVHIGNNVFIGNSATILMGTCIGNNVIIGANTVVRGKIPDDVVVAGNPCKVVCTLEEYYRRRCEKELECAYNNVRLCKERLKRTPTIREGGAAFAWLYLPRTMETIKTYPEFFSLPGENRDTLIRDFLQSEPMFSSYDEFLLSAENKVL